jgi:hypothetical protein
VPTERVGAPSSRQYPDLLLGLCLQAPMGASGYYRSCHVGERNRCKKADCEWRESWGPAQSRCQRVWLLKPGAKYWMTVRWLSSEVGWWGRRGFQFPGEWGAFDPQRVDRAASERTADHKKA